MKSRIFKKVSALCLAAVMCLFPISAFAADTPSSWAQADVNKAVAAKLVPQNLQSQYTQATTRAEFCALVVAVYETVTDKEITGRTKFNDTGSTDVEKAAAISVVSGTGDNNFSPNTGLTREQAATMLSRLAQALDKPLPKQAATFADNNNISSWALEAVGQIQAAGIMGGVGNNTFAPQSDYTREQSIVTTLRLYDVVEGNTENTNNPQPTPTANPAPTPPQPIPTPTPKTTTQSTTSYNVNADGVKFLYTWDNASKINVSIPNGATHITVDVYDVLYMFSNDWEVVTLPFRNSFEALGFTGTVSNGDYIYSKDGEYFIILGKEKSQKVMNESGMVYIAHYIEPSISPTPTPTQTTQPAPTATPQPTPTKTSTPSYAKYSGVPDFGAFVGRQASRELNTDDGTIYYYIVFNEGMTEYFSVDKKNEYIDLLVSQGFSKTGKLSNGADAYSSDKFLVSVITDYETFGKVKEMVVKILVTTKPTPQPTTTPTTPDSSSEAKEWQCTACGKTGKGKVVIPSNKQIPPITPGCPSTKTGNHIWVIRQS